MSNDLTTETPTEEPTAFTALQSPAVETSNSNDILESEHITSGNTSSLFSSAVLAYVQVMNFGWSLVQLNYSAFHNVDDCKAVPIKPNTCVMFPGHTQADWTWIVNIWVIGGMISALAGGRIAEAFGRKGALTINGFVMIVGAVLQAVAPNKGVFILGRFVGGLATGLATAVPNGYISEIAPPHLRGKLGAIYQVAIIVGSLLAVIVQFAVGPTTKWHYGFLVPVAFGAIYLLGAPFSMVESPIWLLARGKREQAEREIARLFGEDGVAGALAWMQTDSKPKEETETDPSVQSMDAVSPAVSFGDLFVPSCRFQTTISIVMAMAMQFCGINAVYMYSSSIFEDAGLSDGRVGSLIINTVALFPPIAAGYVATRFGNRKALVGGNIGMLVCAVVLTIALVAKIGALAIAFASIYVAIFAMTIGPLTFIVAADLFPEALCAYGSALCMFVNWLATLVVGVGYPYVSDALGSLGFLPFVVLIILLAGYQWRYLPDTTGKTSAEIQALFQDQKPAPSKVDAV